jgi:hypothetical protein
MTGFQNQIDTRPADAERFGDGCTLRAAEGRLSPHLQLR